MKRCCSDDNPKIVKRFYDWGDKQMEISLCAQHQKDPDFSHFVWEERICF